MFTPVFDNGVNAYTADTANATNTITAAPTDPNATVTIEVNGTEAANGSAGTWNEGANEVAVTVVNGGETAEYTVTVTKS